MVNREFTKLHNIEFLRFIFAIIIVYHHILHETIMPFIGENRTYRQLAQLANGEYIVEAFFIMSGYFLYQSLKKQDHHDVVHFMKEKALRLGPVLWFSIIISVLFYKMHLEIAVFNSLFMQCTGLSLSYRGITWYISPLFWGLTFYYAICSNFSKNKVLIFTAVLVYFSYLVNITYTSGGFARETVYGIVNLGLARALGGIGLGYLLGYWNEYEYASAVSKTLSQKLCLKHGKKIFFTMLEAIILLYLIGVFVYRFTYASGMLLVILFSILFMLFVNKSGYISQFMNWEFFSVLGRYGYSIYVMQQIGFNILKASLWKTSMMNHPYLCISLSVLFCVALGILVYHLVEQPCLRLSKKLL